jgi:cell fate regulator YaaT (PSP1 superfamily)
MRQIGVRDEAKLLDGHGRCGYRLCCAAWMQEFEPVSIRLAKQQDLPLNPAEISGACGRLLCCLCYESEAYAEALRRLPKKRSKVFTVHGEATVQRVHPLKDSVTVRLEGSESTMEVPLEDLILPGSQPEAQKPKPATQSRRGRGRKRRRPASRRRQ